VAAAVVDHALADDTVLDRAALLAVIKDMLDELPGMIEELEAQARASAQDLDHAQHTGSTNLFPIRPIRNVSTSSPGALMQRKERSN
jgi:hypothetical protein